LQKSIKTDGQARGPNSAAEKEDMACKLDSRIEMSEGAFENTHGILIKPRN
jgi:hypothetical protein